jgi:tRNA(Arg) A34 adenosine deaminase TadA
MDKRDEAFLRRAFAVARRAVEHGNLPFGAILVDARRDVVLESENTSITEHDLTAHAEVMLMHAAARRFEPAYLNQCTMYTSAEPCPMCAGAVYWAGVRRVVYGIDILSLDAVIGADPLNPTPRLRAAAVLAGGKFPIALEGPALVEEATAVHAGVWQRKGRALDTSGGVPTQPGPLAVSTDQPSPTP